MTQFEDAFTKAGLTPAGKDLRAALAKYFNSKAWSFEEYDREVAQARAQMAEKGHWFLDAQKHGADLRQPNPDAGQRHIDAQSSDAGARDPIPGSGQRESDAHVSAAADQEPKPGRAGHARPETQSSPARPGRVPQSVAKNQAPSPERMRAVRTAGHTTTPTIFDTFKVPDGRPIGDITYAELGGLISTNMVFMSIFRQIQLHGVPPRDKAKVRTLIKEGTLKRFVTDAQRLHDVRTSEGVMMSSEGKWSLVRGAA
jgi:hypothetical protein